MEHTVVTRYSVDIGIKQHIKCALVSDLHDRCPDTAISLLSKQKPDIILAAGDLMERHEKEMSPWTVEQMDAWQGISRYRTCFTKLIKALDGSLMSGGNERKKWDEKNGYRFLKEAIKIAPVVMGVGNHEWYYSPEDYSFMERENIILLDNQSCCLTIKGKLLHIGALSTRYDLEWLSDFSKVEERKILICHHPDYYAKYIMGTKKDTFDLVVSGHTHGGQWRLFSSHGRKRGKPVFAPGQGLFPKYAYGQYGKLIISSGVSNTTSIPRFGNPCEVVIIDLK